MKILYGLSGEGFGHSSRALTIIPYLKSNGHKVTVMTYGQALGVMKKQGFEVFPIKGTTIKFKKGKLDEIATIKKSFINFVNNVKKSNKVHKLMKTKFDIVITDFEPLIAILSFWYNLPLLSIDNQHRLTNLELKIPSKYQKDFFIANQIVSLFVSKADWYIIASFSQNKIKDKFKKNTFLVQPFVRKDVKWIKPIIQNKILVYLTKKNTHLINTLNKINEKFIVYGYNIKKEKGNIEFKKRETFLEDLRTCKAVIASAGFTLISESLYLKKPYLALPLHGQFEQMLNALFLKNSGYGDYTEIINEEKIKEFIAKIPIFNKKLEGYSINEKGLFFILDKILKKLKK